VTGAVRRWWANGATSDASASLQPFRPNFDAAQNLGLAEAGDLHDSHDRRSETSAGQSGPLRVHTGTGSCDDVTAHTRLGSGKCM
jgi:hypothetical protein